jgi:predicted metal-dependent hydrolase
VTEQIIRMDIKGRVIPVRLRRNNKARRIILRVDQDIDGAVLTLPRRAAEAEALALLEAQSSWLLDRLDGMPPRVPFADGAVIPILGDGHLIRHVPDLRGGVIREAGDIKVSGRIEHLPRRVRDWVRKEARAAIEPVADEFARRLDLRFAKISVRDTKSRWGSCAASGNLSFSWRLIMAPQRVLDYLVAHEVSHLAHMNHGPAFWRTVASLDVETDRAREWLNRESARLHRIGS